MSNQPYKFRVFIGSNFYLDKLMDSLPLDWTFQVSLKAYLPEGEEPTYKGVKSAFAAFVALGGEKVAFRLSSYDSDIDFNIIRALIKDQVILPHEIKIEYFDSSTQILHLVEVSGNGRLLRWPFGMFASIEESLAYIARK